MSWTDHGMWVLMHSTSQNLTTPLFLSKWQQKSVTVVMWHTLIVWSLWYVRGILILHTIQICEPVHGNDEWTSICRFCTWYTVILEQKIFVQLIMQFPAIMKPESSPPSSQKPTFQTCSEITPNLQVQILFVNFDFILSTSLRTYQVVSFSKTRQLKFSINLFPLMLHAPPIIDYIINKLRFTVGVASKLLDCPCVAVRNESFFALNSVHK
jgi:hypothetical protein